MGLFNRVFGRGDRVPEWARFMSREEFRDFLDAVDDDLNRRALTHSIDRKGGIVRLANPSDPDRFLGLLNLAQVCHQNATDDWPTIIAGHFDSTLVATEEKRAVLDRLGEDFEQARPVLKVRLFPDSLPKREAFTLREPMAGVVAVLSYDFPDQVVSVPSSHVEAWGRPVDELFELGLANVKAQDPADGPHPIDIGDGVSFRALTGQSFFISSHALFLGDYLDPVPAEGALVAVPQRHCVLYHPIADPTVVPTLNALIAIAHGQHEEGPGSITPNVFWWRDGRFTLLPADVTAKRIEFRPPDEFIAMLERVLAEP